MASWLLLCVDEESPDCITDDGILNFCKELGIDAQDPVILALSWYMEAEAMCVFTRQEFVRGLEKLQCCSMDDLKAQLPMLRSKLRNREDFLHIYLVRSLVPGDGLSRLGHGSVTHFFS